MNKLMRVLIWPARVIVAFLVPFILIMTSVRLLMNPFFLEIEYRMPGFPPDSYGFTLQERLQWSKVSLDFLLNSADLSYFDNQKFADGTPIYTERELSHMIDVKRLLQTLLNLWLGSLVLMLALWLWAWRTGWWLRFRRSVSIGGWVTVGIIVLIVIFMAISFTTFFTDFHELFFTGNSWIFLYSDTFIRLFPIRFWEDAFIYVGLLCLIGGILLGLFMRPKAPKEIQP
jgi:integral membrane protein (TIGR01906 family)